MAANWHNCEDILVNDQKGRVRLVGSDILLIPPPVLFALNTSICIIVIESKCNLVARKD